METFTIFRDPVSWVKLVRVQERLFVELANVCPCLLCPARMPNKKMFDQEEYIDILLDYFQLARCHQDEID